MTTKNKGDDVSNDDTVMSEAAVESYKNDYKKNQSEDEVGTATDIKEAQVEEEEKRRCLIEGQRDRLPMSLSLSLSLYIYIYI